MIKVDYNNIDVTKLIKYLWLVDYNIYFHFWNVKKNIKILKVGNISVDFHFKLPVIYFMDITCINCALFSTIPIGCTILRFSIDIWHLIQHYSINILLHYIDSVLLMMVFYRKRSSSPLCNFLSDLINGAYD